MKTTIEIVILSLFSALAILEKPDLVAIIVTRVAWANGLILKITHRPSSTQDGTSQPYIVRHV